MPFQTAIAACSVCALIACLAGEARAETRRVIAADPLAKEMTGRDVSFLARDLETQEACLLENSDLETRHGPWSSFKIPNLLIALETGAADGLHAERSWDPQRRPAAGYWPEDWRRDQTLESAFRRSAAWYFQDVAVDVGAQTYRTVLDAWRYGNAAAPEASDRFWLDRTLRISVSEQVAFLSRLLSGSLDVAPKNVEALATASLDRRSPEISLHGKTGSGPLVPGDFSRPFEGWYVGWVARTGMQPIPFALYARAATYGEIREFRREFALRMLTECGYLPDGFDR
ncbi:penicillin-binding transpeptidase domain-containing protein [Dinoroseobacter sp. S375]|uniref:penicillin-binding transpeptidase domain-containing protein n=1 Tax=Dinoroseobacter sp. S375 TaxID=3415136 RepID=UPI003C7D4AB9